MFGQREEIKVLLISKQYSLHSAAASAAVFVLYYYLYENKKKCQSKASFLFIQPDQSHQTAPSSLTPPWLHGPSLSVFFFSL